MATEKHQTFKRWRRRSLYVLLGLLIILLWQLFAWAPTYQGTNQTTQRRAVWLTDLGTAALSASNRLDEFSYRLARLHFNTVYPAVWDRGYTLYPSQVALEHTGRRQSPIVKRLPFGDPLRKLVKEGHRQQLQVIPWFEYGLSIPESSELLAYHPDWVTVTSQGDRYIDKPPQPSAWLQKLPSSWRRGIIELTGGNTVWLNPFHPGVQQFLVDLIVEAVEEYDIDGIALDDHFGLPVQLGYDRFTVSLYQQEHGGRVPPNNFDRPEWVAWRAQKLTELMAKISRAVKAVDPDCLISVQPNPSRFAYQRYLQDWVGWTRQKLLDEIVLQAYRETPAAVAEVLQEPGARQGRQYVPVVGGIYSGRLSSPRTVEAIALKQKSHWSTAMELAFFAGNRPSDGSKRIRMRRSMEKSLLYFLKEKAPR